MTQGLSKSLTRQERRSIVALLISVMCTSMAVNAGSIALGKQVFDLTHRSLDLGWLGLAEFAPAALLVLVTGAVSDRYDRRFVVAIAAGGEALVAAALALYATSKPTSATPIFGLVIVFGTFRAFVAPAERSLPADILGDDRLPWLIARFSAAWQVALICGPVLGGFLYAVHPAWAYVAMSALLVCGSLAALVVRTPARGTRPSDRAAYDDGAAVEAMVESAERPSPSPSARGTVREAMEGLRFIRGERLVFAAISLDLFAVLFGGAVALLPAIAETRLHVGAVGLGWLRAAAGLGAAVTTGLLAWKPLRRRVGRVLLAVVAIFGLGTLVLGITRSYALAFVAMAVLSGADAVSVFIRATLVPLVTPTAVRGRVLAVENVFIGASNELGAFESGVVGQWLGPATAVVLGGLATLAVAATWWYAFPVLREVDDFPVRVEEPAGRYE